MHVPRRNEKGHGSKHGSGNILAAQQRRHNYRNERKHAGHSVQHIQQHERVPRLVRVPGGRHVLPRQVVNGAGDKVQRLARGTPREGVARRCYVRVQLPQHSNVQPL